MSNIFYLSYQIVSQNISPLPKGVVTASNAAMPVTSGLAKRAFSAVA